jgi:hypothetical protein
MQKKKKTVVVAVPVAPAAEPRKGLFARVLEALGFRSAPLVRDSELDQPRLCRMLLDNALRGERMVSEEMLNRGRKTLEQQIQAVRAAGDFRAPVATPVAVAPVAVAPAAAPARVWGVLNTLDKARLRAWSRAWSEAQAEAQPVAEPVAEPVATRARDARGRFVKA